MDGPTAQQWGTACIVFDVPLRATSCVDLLSYGDRPNWAHDVAASTAGIQAFQIQED
jgi:hypothetical protein